MLALDGESGGVSGTVVKDKFCAPRLGLTLESTVGSVSFETTTVFIWAMFVVRDRKDIG